MRKKMLATFIAATSTFMMMGASPAQAATQDLGTRSWTFSGPLGTLTVQQFVRVDTTNHVLRGYSRLIPPSGVTVKSLSYYGLYVDRQNCCGLSVVLQNEYSLTYSPGVSPALVGNSATYACPASGGGYMSNSYGTVYLQYGSNAPVAYSVQPTASSYRIQTIC